MTETIKNVWYQGGNPILVDGYKYLMGSYIPEVPKNYLVGVEYFIEQDELQIKLLNRKDRIMRASTPCIVVEKVEVLKVKAKPKVVKKQPKVKAKSTFNILKSKFKK